MKTVGSRFFYKLSFILWVITVDAASYYSDDHFHGDYGDHSHHHHDNDDVLSDTGKAVVGTAALAGAGALAYGLYKKMHPAPAPAAPPPSPASPSSNVPANSPSTSILSKVEGMFGGASPGSTAPISASPSSTAPISASPSSTAPISASPSSTAPTNSPSTSILSKVEGMFGGASTQQPQAQLIPQPQPQPQAQSQVQPQQQVQMEQLQPQLPQLQPQLLQAQPQVQSQQLQTPPPSAYFLPNQAQQLQLQQQSPVPLQPQQEIVQPQYQWDRNQLPPVNPMTPAYFPPPQPQNRTGTERILNGVSNFSNEVFQENRNELKGLLAAKMLGIDYHPRMMYNKSVGMYDSQDSDPSQPTDSDYYHFNPHYYPPHRSERCYPSPSKSQSSCYHNHHCHHHHHQHQHQSERCCPHPPQSKCHHSRHNHHHHYYPPHQSEECNPPPSQSQKCHHSRHHHHPHPSPPPQSRSSCYPQENENEESYSTPQYELKDTVANDLEKRGGPFRFPSVFLTTPGQKLPNPKEYLPENHIPTL